jgi:hypothetical protein
VDQRPRRVAGWSGNAAGARRAVVWDPVMGVRDLGVLPGGSEHGVRDQRRRRAVVGLAAPRRRHARRPLERDRGDPRSRDAARGSFSVAYGINAASQVVGQSTTVEGDDHAVR